MSKPKPDQGPKPKEKNESIVFSPIVMLSLIGSCIVGGVGWIPYAIFSLLASNMVGFYTEAKINELDAVTRAKAKEATGEEQPGDASDLGEFVRKTNQVLGVFCPAVPLVSLCAGWYMSRKAHRLAKVGCGYNPKPTEETALPPGFVAEGKCVF